VDLMFSRRVPLPKAEERQHLVVELKRPKKKVDLMVTTQIESYAMRRLTPLTPPARGAGRLLRQPRGPPLARANSRSQPIAKGVRSS
jgi:hypothetical protein